MNLSIKPYKFVRTIPLAFMLMTPSLCINAANMQQKPDTYESANSLSADIENATKFNPDNSVKTFTAAALLILGMFGVAQYLNSHHNHNNKKNEG